jgi:hypothetical protein
VDTRWLVVMMLLVWLAGLVAAAFGFVLALVTGYPWLALAVAIAGAAFFARGWTTVRPVLVEFRDHGWGNDR